MKFFRHRPLCSRRSLAATGFACAFACGALLSGPSAAERIEFVGALDVGRALDWQPSPMPPEVIDRARRTQLDLELRGILDAGRTAAAPSFSWPLRQSAAFDHPACWGSVSFVDHDPRFGYLLDYHGGQRTYDIPELRYNHQGSDFLAWPFGWVKVALAQVEVVAAAPGWIVARVDGNFDQECGRPTEVERQANLVVIAHVDGSMAVYGHLKKGSVTTKQPGESVERGEYLGAVGSSGFTSYPHLHFEVTDLAGRVVDPFAGPANDTTAESWWREQPPYYDSRFYAIMTHSAEPTVACNNREWTWVQRRFAPGDDVYLVAYLRDLRKGQRVKLWVIDPNGVTAGSASFRARDPHWAIDLLTHRLKLAADAPPGLWTYRAKFGGEILEQPFEVGRFEPLSGVATVRPKRVRPGARRKIRITGFGFSEELVAYVASPVEIERNIEVLKSRIKPRRIRLTLRVGSAASPGSRHVVLTAPDYSQLVLEDAFEVAASPARRQR